MSKPTLAEQLEAALRLNADLKNAVDRLETTERAAKDELAKLTASLHETETMLADKIAALAAADTLNKELQRDLAALKETFEQRVKTESARIAAETTASQGVTRAVPTDAQPAESKPLLERINAIANPVERARFIRDNYAKLVAEFAAAKK